MQADIHRIKSWKKALSLTLADETEIRISFFSSLYFLILLKECFLFLSFPFFSFCFLGPQMQHMEVPKPGVESEIQLPATATVTATAISGTSHICDLHHSSWQCWILNPLSEAWDQTHIIMDTSWVNFCWATGGTLKECLLLTSQKNIFRDLEANIT